MALVRTQIDLYFESMNTNFDVILGASASADRAWREPSPGSRPCGLGPLPDSRTALKGGCNALARRRLVPAQCNPLARRRLPTPMGKASLPGMPDCRMQPPCGGLPTVDGRCWPWASKERSPRGGSTSRQSSLTVCPLPLPFRELYPGRPRSQGCAPRSHHPVPALRLGCGFRAAPACPLTPRPDALGISFAGNGARANGE